MNILDEQVMDSQRLLLKSWGIAVRHIGHDVGRKGMKDYEIIPFLIQLRHPEFDTIAKRMGKVIRVSSLGLAVWRLHSEKEDHLDWKN